MINCDRFPSLKAQLIVFMMLIPITKLEASLILDLTGLTDSLFKHRLLTC